MDLVEDALNLGDPVLKQLDRWENAEAIRPRRRRVDRGKKLWCIRYGAFLLDDMLLVHNNGFLAGSQKTRVPWNGCLLVLFTMRWMQNFANCLRKKSGHLPTSMRCARRSKGAQNIGLGRCACAERRKKMRYPGGWHHGTRSCSYLRLWAPDITA